MDDFQGTYKDQQLLKELLSADSTVILHKWISEVIPGGIPTVLLMNEEDKF
jgi:hypothetical protein